MSINNSISNLDHLIEDLSLKNHNTKKQFNDYKLDRSTFCVMPFVTIILEPDGNIGVCRHKGSKFTFGNLRDFSIEEIWSSEKIINWRQDFASGVINICKTEVSDRKCNQCPEMNQLLPFAEIHNLKNPKILRLTANFNGQCNLQCQMCDIWKLPNGFYTEENFWKPARKKFFHDIMEIDLLSGEPFIQSDTYKLIEEVSRVNPNCQWTFTTNAHWNMSDKIKSALGKIKIKNIILSVDSLNKNTYYKIRYPGNIDFVKNNIERLLIYQEERIHNHLSPLNLRLNCLIQKDNWKEAKEIIHYCIDRKIVPFLTFLYEPNQFSLLTLEYKERLNILDYFINEFDDKEYLFVQRIVKPLIKSLNKIDYMTYLLKMYEKNI